MSGGTEVHLEGVLAQVGEKASAVNVGSGIAQAAVDTVGGKGGEGGKGGSGGTGGVAAGGTSNTDTVGVGKEDDISIRLLLIIIVALLAFLVILVAARSGATMVIL